MASAVPHFIVVVSDLHAGSSVAVRTPDDFELDDGQYSRPSLPQRVLWDQWQTFWGRFVPDVTGGQPFSVVVNGDLTENMHHATQQVASSQTSDHVRMAVTLLKPIRERARQLWVVRGTEAHAGPSASLEEAVAREVQADRGHEHTGSHWELWLELGPHLCHFAHHIGTTSSTSYEHSALSRELAANLLESAQWGNRPADIIVRSHRHRYSAATIPTARGQSEIIVTPSWQLRTAFAWKKVSMRLPQIGGVVLGYDKWGYTVRSYTWVPPRPQAISTGKRSTRNSTARSRPKG